MLYNQASFFIIPQILDIDLLISHSCHQELRKNNRRFVCQNNRQDSRADRLQYINFINNKPIGRIKCALI